jgi:hypothetical protein
MLTERDARPPLISCRLSRTYQHSARYASLRQEISVVPPFFLPFSLETFPYRMSRSCHARLPTSDGAPILTISATDVRKVAFFPQLFVSNTYSSLTLMKKEKNSLLRCSSPSAQYCTGRQATQVSSALYFTSNTRQSVTSVHVAASRRILLLSNTRRGPRVQTKLLNDSVRTSVSKHREETQLFRYPIRFN